MTWTFSSSARARAPSLPKTWVSEPQEEQRKVAMFWRMMGDGDGGELYLDQAQHGDAHLLVHVYSLPGVS